MASQAQDINATNRHPLILTAAEFRRRCGRGWGAVQGVCTMIPLPSPQGQLKVLVFAVFFEFC